MKTKTLAILFLILTFISSCNSTKMVEKGNYDDALRTAVRKLQKDKTDPIQIKSLKDAYQAATAADKEKIDNYARNNQYDHMIKIYRQMQERQELVKTVLPLNLNGETIDYKQVDYNNKISQTKTSAGKFYYTKALSLYHTDTKNGYYNAYKSLETAKSYIGNHDSITRFMNNCVEKGSYKVLVSVMSYNSRISDRVLASIANQAVANSGSMWFKYYSASTIGRTTPDIKTICNINNIIIGVNSEEKTKRDFSVEEDKGTEYVRDSKGNVVRDADGKMVKKQNIVHYSCQYLETSQVKRGELIVQNSYYNARNGNLMFRGEETSVVYDFINRYATIRGDIKALPPELRPNLRNVPIQYPTTSEMIAQLCKTLENALPEMLAQPEEYIFNNY